MIAKDKLSEFEKTLADNKMEAIIFKLELDRMKTTHKAVKVNIKELEEENGVLEEACGLFDKVNSNYNDRCSTNALFKT